MRLFSDAVPSGLNRNLHSDCRGHLGPSITETDWRRNTPHKPQAPIITGPSTTQRAKFECRHALSGMYTEIAATPAQARTRKIRFSFGRRCSFCGINIPIQAAMSPAQPPAVSAIVLAMKVSVYLSGFASVLARVGNSASDKTIPIRMKSIAGASTTKPAISHTADISLSRSTG